MNNLVALARRINDREEAIEALRRQSVNKVNETLAEVLLQGQDLIEIKARCAHGNWQSWLRANCPKLSLRSAQRYMALAAKAPGVERLTESDSLRAALALCDLEGADQKSGPKQWPPYMEAIGRLSKLVGFVTRFPVTQWPDEGLDKFREELQPIAALLWPDRFVPGAAAAGAHHHQ
jgi:hypothetical protein